ncbi:MAG: hypothetical protein HC888_02375 [Candidatus Competibacteraceae bacterium]|nr:hypothetical protein [Candidatus Competibacteraceae bacterium]
MTCACDIAARLDALNNIIIPEEFRKLTIHDFNGNDRNGVPILSTKVAAQAKSKLIQYCWGDVTANKLQSMNLAARVAASKLADRFEDGRNVVIHGGSSKTIKKDTDGKTIVKSKPKGKTFMASILTREAILLSSNPKWQRLTYDWVNFATLLHELKEQPEEASSYLFADWLVIDNIGESYATSASKAQKLLHSGLLDPFFYQRMKNKLPTLMVCKFDVDARSTELEEAFGDAFSTLIESPKTMKICLTESDG